MGSTGVKSLKSFDEFFKLEFENILNDKSVLKWIENKVPPPMDTGIDEESEFFLAQRDLRGSITCVVIIMKRCDNEIIYKVMDESTGPFCITRCPKEIMKLLSPVSELSYAGFAESWRNRQ